MELHMNNAINWFELPVTDMARATKFYESMLAVTLKSEVFAGTPNAIFPADDLAVGGALIYDARRRPNPDGPLVYLNAGMKLDDCLSRVSSAGGKVVLPKTDIGDPGFIALVLDTEGNQIGLHQPRAQK